MFLSCAARAGASARTVPVNSPPKEYSVAAAHWLRYAHLAFLSRPKSVRPLYRLVKGHKICRILEIGISDITRSVALIEVAQRYAVSSPVHHTGLDWFEARPQHQSKLALKHAHCLLRATGGQIRLVPGEPARSLAVVANAHQNMDLILISAAVADDDLVASWFFVPRMLHSRSLILRERRTVQGEPSFDWLSHSQVAEWAGRKSARRAA